MDCKTLIGFEAVSLEYSVAGKPNKVIFDDLTFSVEPGSITAVVGRSGSGKSTVLDVAYGKLPPSSGRVSWCDRDLSSLRESEAQHIRRANIGYVDQKALLLGDLTVLKNVMCGGVDKTTAHSWLEKLGVADISDSRGAKISGGEAQRVALARALAKQPDLLILDEPTSSLDLGNAHVVAEILQLEARRGAGILVATHDDVIGAIANMKVTL
ncbi:MULTISPECIES: ABC transporter ATP-binding protein [Actinotignum]|uniref:ATP-binding cassette domain-containing protein n=2 Tax=Actinotignum timonense TaxID=1870995 RepID=A0AAW9HNC2_9ACTO|nr:MULTISPECIES: ATP-binding cassette domain-containing protein [Actinotignum]MDE1664077.1 ATP-binding cassette domain-containing protein [Actinotignum schaalii]MDK6373526.1 ATP-binding cassette domain-containing protein [Actinotignum timonense]MDK6419535.1 ATP-binding cassette domain-containing protein [Actinotignum timonense]MDK6590346.1 ATP-binding cassette domain-containing protein [Actinotignum timonense]MDK6628840.1 ATP-binding cassette domain-containing protein [Actinotignum timonense]